MAVQVHVNSVDHCDSVARHCDLHLEFQESHLLQAFQAMVVQDHDWKGCQVATDQTTEEYPSSVYHCHLREYRSRAQVDLFQWNLVARAPWCASHLPRHGGLVKLASHGLP
mmetsp:Transcript_101544/g.141037  ORF Transcript_101544/g.141037 Transcript_101544/m.141037 type:complete len:111 (-) Transcript_101544:209-541(-)